MLSDFIFLLYLLTNEKTLETMHGHILRLPHFQTKRRTWTSIVLSNMFCLLNCLVLSMT